MASYPGASVDAARPFGEGEQPVSSLRTAPLPARLQPPDDTFFTGREHEGERWDESWKRVLTGERRGWLVGGEAGIGKTTPIGHLAARAQADAALVVYGRCDEDVGIPYQPWIEALSALIAAVPDRTIAAHVAGRGGRLARLVPELAARTGVQAPEASDGRPSAMRCSEPSATS